MLNQVGNKRLALTFSIPISGSVISEVSSYHSQTYPRERRFGIRPAPKGYSSVERACNPPGSEGIRDGNSEVERFHRGSAL